ncbi:hypothetical protein HanPSC8_Chr11g0460121 [Helianthus annuus]|nr:hypothetical protein HanPSC8_Chr11g0460121 [Helianthus annuus]
MVINEINSLFLVNMLVNLLLICYFNKCHNFPLILCFYSFNLVLILEICKERS